MIPTGVEVCEKQLFHIIRNIHEQEVNNEAIEQYMPAIYEELKDLSKEELIKRFASVEFNRFIEYYRDARDINIYPKEGRRRDGDSGKAAGANGMSRMFVNIGTIDGVSKKDFLQLLVQEVGVPMPAIGSIDMGRTNCHFDVEPSYVKQLMKSLSEFNLNGRKVRVDEALPRTEKFSKSGGGEKGRFSKPDFGKFGDRGRSSSKSDFGKPGKGFGGKKKSKY
jgi:ATP-dependent RNA helicase DeaD